MGDLSGKLSGNGLKNLQVGRNLKIVLEGVDENCCKIIRFVFNLWYEY